ASTMLTAPAQRVCFGSSLERRLFPLHYAPDRLGNQMAQQGPPHIGPGSYDNHEVFYDLQKTPGSKKGYSLSARTAVRFPPCNKVRYTKKVSPPGKIAFNAKAQRFKPTPCTSERSPGVTNRKVSWPMCFGRPDWSSLPQIGKKSLRVKLASEKEYLKQRSRVAYLNLYY
uniref:Protein pitchfork-like n=1 Tax=Neolamprologus brichardi TaxID=32507 RepID=A0A3Q4G6I2_NEOBR